MGTRWSPSFSPGCLLSPGTVGLSRSCSSVPEARKPWANAGALASRGSFTVPGDSWGEQLVSERPNEVRKPWADAGALSFLLVVYCPQGQLGEPLVLERPGSA